MRTTRSLTFPFALLLALALLCSSALLVAAHGDHDEPEAAADAGKAQKGAPPTKLQIGVTKAVPADECKIKSQKGDKLSMHYTGRLVSGAVERRFTRLLPSDGDTC